MHEMIYMVVEGDVSETWIRCACRTRDEAERLIARMEPHQGCMFSIEESWIVTPDIQAVKYYQMSWDVSDGEYGRDVQVSEDLAWPFDDPPVASWHWRSCAATRDGTWPNHGVLSAYGTDMETLSHVVGAVRAMVAADHSLIQRDADVNGDGSDVSSIADGVA